MKTTNLKESAHYIDKTQALIEKSFGYPEEQSFKRDFYPLFNESNFQNCHILVNEDEVIAHIGVKAKYIDLNGHTFRLNFYGGIAIAEKYQGQGLFKDFFKSLLKQYNDCTLHLLWSEKTELYKKFGFYPAIEQFKYLQKDNPSPTDNYEICKLSKLNSNQKNFLIKSYSNIIEKRILRSDHEWNEVFEISSATVYFFKKDGKYINYFIKNKGADLTNIIHEYSFLTEEFLEKFTHLGEVWTPSFISQKIDYDILFAALVKPGETKSFNHFIKLYSGAIVESLSEDKIKFHFNGAFYEASITDFLQGLFGPGKYKEFLKTDPFFISGLDSI